MAPPISERVDYLRKTDRHVIEPMMETDDRWLAHHDELANATLVAKTKSWYTGANVEGKQNRLLGYIGGLPSYIEAYDKVKERGYEGFAIG